MAHFTMPEMPEWVGVAIRWPDGRIDAYELRGYIEGEIRAECDVDDSLPFGEDILWGTKRVHVEFSAEQATRWHQGAEAAPPEAQREIEPAQKAIEA